MKFTAEKAKKRLFISLLCITYVIMLIVCAGVWFITLPGLNNINSHLAPAFAAAMIGILFLVGFGILGMVSFFLSNRLDYYVIKRISRTSVMFDEETKSQSRRYRQRVAAGI